MTTRRALLGHRSHSARCVGLCVLWGVGALVGCNSQKSKGSIEEQGGQVDAFPEPCPRVSGDRAKELVAEGATLLDVRTQSEFEQGHIEGAQLIPHDEIEERMDQVPQGEPVVVYCRSGRRAGIAAEKLRDAGYEVYNLGGVDDWETRGDPCAD